MVIAIDTPMWGEHEAGYEFDVDWHEKRALASACRRRSRACGSARTTS